MPTGSLLARRAKKRGYLKRDQSCANLQPILEEGHLPYCRIASWTFPLLNREEMKRSRLKIYVWASVIMTLTTVFLWVIAGRADLQLATIGHMLEKKEMVLNPITRLLIDHFYTQYYGTTSMGFVNLGLAFALWFFISAPSIRSRVELQLFFFRSYLTFVLLMAVLSALVLEGTLGFMIPINYPMGVGQDTPIREPVSVYLFPWVQNALFALIVCSIARAFLKERRRCNHEKVSRVSTR